MIFLNCLMYTCLLHSYTVTDVSTLSTIKFMDIREISAVVGPLETYSEISRLSIVILFLHDLYT